MSKNQDRQICWALLGWESSWGHPTLKEIPRQVVLPPSHIPSHFFAKSHYYKYIYGNSLSKWKASSSKCPNIKTGSVMVLQEMCQFKVGKHGAGETAQWLEYSLWSGNARTHNPSTHRKCPLGMVATCNSSFWRMKMGFLEQTNQTSFTGTFWFCPLKSNVILNVETLVCHNCWKTKVFLIPFVYGCVCVCMCVPLYVQVCAPMYVQREASFIEPEALHS